MKLTRYAALTRALGELKVSAEYAQRQFHLFHNAMERLRRDFETSLSFAEMKRYLRMVEGDERMPWFDAALIIEQRR